MQCLKSVYTHLHINYFKTKTCLSTNMTKHIQTTSSSSAKSSLNCQIDVFLIFTKACVDLSPTGLRTKLYFGTIYSVLYNILKYMGREMIQRISIRESIKSLNWIRFYYISSFQTILKMLSPKLSDNSLNVFSIKD